MYCSTCGVAKVHANIARTLKVFALFEGEKSGNKRPIEERIGLT